MVRGAVAGVAFDFYAGRDWDLFLPNHAVWRSNPPPLKPRVPNAEDADQSSRCWIDHHTPGGLASVLGQEMPKTSSTLRKLRGRVDDQSFGSHLLISGEDGSGKRALGLAFARDFLGSFQMNPDAKAATSRSRTTAKLLRSHILVLEAAQTLDSKKLESRMRDYLGGRDSFDGILPKILVLRNMHQVKPSAQQVLCAADDASKGRLKMILCGPPSTKLITTLASRVQVMSINKLDKTDSLKVTLQVLSRERVGFDIVALQQLFSLLWPTDLKNIISTVQRIFAQHHYISLENVSKEFRGRRGRDSRCTILPWASIAPLAPCSACTLTPPCSHISEQELAKSGDRRRLELPQWQGATGMINCYTFMNTGACTSFNARGRCSMRHPLSAHIVAQAKPRCQKCTLVLPCGKCPYDAARKRLVKAIHDFISNLDSRSADLRAWNDGLAASSEEKFLLVEAIEQTVAHLHRIRDWAENSCTALEPGPYEMRQSEAERMHDRTVSKVDSWLSGSSLHQSSTNSSKSTSEKASSVSVRSKGRL